MKRLGLLLLAGSITTPAAAQQGGFADSLKSIKDSASRLGAIWGKKKVATEPAAGAPQAPSAVPETEADVSFSGIEEEASDTQLELAAVRAPDVATYDILGLKLGMSLKEANRVGRKSRFRPAIGSNNNYSFEGRARLLANNRLSRPLAMPRMVPEYSHAVRPGNGDLAVDWLPEAAGVRIGGLRYSAPTEGNTTEAITRQMIAKYGKPTVTDAYGGVNMTWCSPQETACRVYDHRRPALFATINGGKLSLTLAAGQAQREANEKAIAARADALAGSNARAVSF